MRTRGFCKAIAYVLPCLAALAASGAAWAQPPRGTPDAFTPVVVSRMGPRPAAFPATDGLYHLVYELELTNVRQSPATLKKIEVLDASSPSRVLASYSGKDLLGSLRTLGLRPASSAVIPFDSSCLFFIELAFKPGHVPQAVTHSFSLLGASNFSPSAQPVLLDYTAERIELDDAPLPVIGPPLEGSGWLVINGCCNSRIVHRGSFLGVNGRLYDSERFAIDYVRLNKEDEIVHGNPDKVQNYVDYGARVLAVADGTVISVTDTLNDQPPGKLPNPADMTLETLGGNNIVLDIGHGLYAFYAHLKKGSVTVHVGEHVKRGMVIGLLGNSGNTSAPHLHFHIMNGPSELGSSGLPYVVDHFDLAGEVSVKQFEEAKSITGSWGKRFGKAVPQSDRFPLDLNIVDFPQQ